MTKHDLCGGQASLTSSGDTLTSSGDTLMSSGDTLMSSGDTLTSSGDTLMSSGDIRPLNFAETLPTEMSVKIFEDLDTVSLCSASQTCRRWRDIIEDSDHLWRTQCLLISAVCQREVDGDRRDGLSWKVTVVKNYTRSRVKTDWLKGRYSHVTSAEQLIGRRMVALDAETWGEILQAELDR